MIRAEAILDAYINANILLVLAFLFWLAVREVMQRVGYGQAFLAQLRLLNVVFLSVLCAPFIALGFSWLQMAGVASNVNLNLSDMVVSHYLNGGFEMSASEFERLILMRDAFTLNVVDGAGWVAKAAIFAFGLGVMIGSIRLFYSVFCLRQIVKRSYFWRGQGRLSILLSDRTLVPFSTRGLVRYYVVIPSHMLGEGHQLRVALAHEFQHIRQGDLEWEIVLEVLKPLFFLNPVFHAWKRRVEELREFSCDSRVLSSGRIDARAYCDTLLSVCQKTLRRDRTFVIAVPKVTLVTADRSARSDGRLGLLESRILSALDSRQAAPRGLAMVLFTLPFLVFIGVASVAVQSPGDWSHDRLMLSTVVNLERLEEINRLSTFGRIRE